MRGFPGKMRVRRMQRSGRARWSEARVARRRRARGRGRWRARARRSAGAPGCSPAEAIVGLGFLLRTSPLRRLVVVLLGFSACSQRGLCPPCPPFWPPPALNRQTIAHTPCMSLERLQDRPCAPPPCAMHHGSITLDFAPRPRAGLVSPVVPVPHHHVHRYGQVVQLVEGLRLHHRRRRRGPVRAPDRDQVGGFRTLQEGEKVGYEPIEDKGKMKAGTSRRPTAAPPAGAAARRAAAAAAASSRASGPRASRRRTASRSVPSSGSTRRRGTASSRRRRPARTSSSTSRRSTPRASVR